MSSEAFLALDAATQQEAFLVGAESLGRSQTILEKDVWVCWALDALFSCPDMPNMAFKGGTSLSKVYNAISRFSEDIDVTMDHKGLAPEIEPYDDSVSGKQKKRDDSALNAAMRARSIEVVVPHLRNRLSEIGLGPEALVVEQDGEHLIINYPHLVEGRDAYYREGVKIEFGGRNMTEPNEVHEITPYLAAEFPDLTFPKAAVSVLSPQRTFWEKFTLAHAESRRTQFKSAERFSRHWYDLAVLSEHEIGRQALEDLTLLADVVKVKTRFYGSPYASYDLCCTGQAALLPNDEGIALLRADYEGMVRAGMLDEPLPFDAVIDRVRLLQTSVNSLYVP